MLDLEKVAKTLSSLNSISVKQEFRCADMQVDGHTVFKVLIMKNSISLQFVTYM